MMLWIIISGAFGFVAGVLAFGAWLNYSPRTVSFEKWQQKHKQ